MAHAMLCAPDDLMGEVMVRGFGFIETNRILAWLPGCLAAWLLGLGGQSYLLFQPELSGSVNINGLLPC
jgi:hypothetical protein